MNHSSEVRAAGRTETGPVRRGNEDCFALDESLGLFVVADGMGGHNAGEMASRVAVEAIAGFVRRSTDTPEFSWPYGIISTLSYDENRLRTAVYLANRRVYRMAESRDDYVGMGTTVVAVLATPGAMVVAHIGDSRAYRMRGGHLEQLTRDDSWIATVLADDPAADPELLANHPMRHVLTNALGSREEADVHLQGHATQPGDLVLLSTDGVHGVLDSPSISALLLQGGDPEAIASGLVTEALARGSRDNLTAVVIEIAGRRDCP